MSGWPPRVEHIDGEFVVLTKVQCPDSSTSTRDPCGPAGARRAPALARKEAVRKAMAGRTKATGLLRQAVLELQRTRYYELCCSLPSDMAGPSLAVALPAASVAEVVSEALAEIEMKLIHLEIGCATRDLEEEAFEVLDSPQSAA